MTAGFAAVLARYEPVIGLEVHCQLLTRSKLFCGCPNRFGAPPNTLVCPVCLGLPGSLPVLNRHAVTLAIRASLALGCRVHDDLGLRAQELLLSGPAQGLPDLAVRGAARDRRLARDRRSGRPAQRAHRTRIHMEEDAGKLLHEGFAWSDEKSGVDLNRAGVPLVEIVTEPDLRSPEEAHAYLTALRGRAALRRRLRRQHGGGLAALRRERLGAAAGRLGARHARRGQEPQLVPQRRARDRARADAAGGARRVRPRGRPGDAAVERRPRRDGAHALEGGRARLPLLPRARPARRSRSRRNGSRRFALPCPSCPRRGGSASSRTTRCPSTTRAC